MVQQNESPIRKHIPSFPGFLAVQVSTERWVEFPVLYSRSSLVVCFIHNISRVYMSVPTSQFSLSPRPPLFPLDIHMSDLYVFTFISALQVRSSIPFSRFHIYALICNICFFLSDLLHSEWVSRSFHISTNDPILFLFVVTLKTIINEFR